jgi:hypothetical protein
MLWTIMPLEMVYQEAAKETRAQHFAMYKGAPVLVERLDENSSRIVRLLSTEPNDYLKADLMPGAVIKQDSQHFI